MWNVELQENVAYNPLMALRRAKSTRDVIEGLVPLGGITWLFGPSMSFKSFVVMGMAAAVSRGEPWLGRRTEAAVVVYLGAEGGDALHVRRAAADMARGGTAGPLVIAQERPMLDSAVGSLHLQGVLNGVTETFWAVVEPFTAGRTEAVYSPELDEALAASREARRKHNEALANRASPDSIDALEAARKEASNKVKALKAKAEASPGVARFDEADARYTLTPMALSEPEHRNLLCIIDTFSQTAEDDTRRSVSSYIKTLRHIIELAAASGFTLSFLVVDHVTKEGGSYLGSVAKLNDVDSQLEMTRLRKSMVATLTPTKNKNGPEGDPVNVELRPFELPDFVDADGRPLRTLVVEPGEAISELLARQPEGNAAHLLDLLREHGGRAAAADVRREFREARVASGVRRESADKAYVRSLERLKEKDIVQVDGDDLVLL